MLENPWSAVWNPTSALGSSGSSFDPSGLSLSNLTTEYTIVLLVTAYREWLLFLKAESVVWAVPVAFRLAFL